MATITNSDELVSNIKHLTTPINLPSNTFSEKMDAGEVNGLFEGIEICLNNLYEKLRMLEDLHDFSEEYIKNEFNKVKPALDDAIVKLGDAAEDYANTTTKANLLTFRGGTIVTDRDGTAINSAQVIDGKIIMAGAAKISEATPTRAVVGSTDIVYRRSEMPADNYKSFYVMESYPVRPVEEYIDFFFARPTIINFIKASAFNAELSNITIYKSNNEILEVSGENMVFPECTAIGIHVELKGGKIEPVRMEVTGDKDTFSSLENVYEEDALNSIFEKHIKDNGGV